MNLTDLKNAAAAAIATDESLTTWAVTTYAQLHQVIIDPDLRALPGADQCPYVIITALDRSGDEERRDREYGLGLIAVVHDDEAGTYDPENLSGYLGGDRVETFARYLSDIVRLTVLGLLPNAAVGVEMEIENMDQFPYRKCMIGISITEHLTIGQAPLDF